MESEFASTEERQLFACALMVDCVQVTSKALAQLIEVANVLKQLGVDPAAFTAEQETTPARRFLMNKKEVTIQ